MISISKYYVHMQLFIHIYIYMATDALLSVRQWLNCQHVANVRTYCVLTTPHSPLPVHSLHF